MSVERSLKPSERIHRHPKNVLEFKVAVLKSAFFSSLLENVR